MKVTYTGNDLAREVPTMREPKADDYTDFLFVFPDSAYYLALEAYGRHLASLQTIPVLPGHNWIEGQTYEEGRDYSREEVSSSPFDNSTHTVLQPIVKGEASILNKKAWGKVDEVGNMIAMNDYADFLEFLRDVYMTPSQFKDCIEQFEKWRENDVASDNKASPSLASHSCTEGNSIEQIYQWALNNKIDAELAKKDEGDQLSKMFLSGVIAAFNDLLNYIPNPEGSVATPDPGSNED